MQKFHQSDVLRVKHLHILIGHAHYGWWGLVGEQTIRQSMPMPMSMPKQKPMPMPTPTPTIFGRFWHAANKLRRALGSTATTTTRTTKDTIGPISELKPRAGHSHCLPPTRRLAGWFGWTWNWPIIRLT